MEGFEYHEIIFWSFDLIIMEEKNYIFFLIWRGHELIRASLVTHIIRNLPAMWRPGFNPWVGKIPGGKHGNPLQYSCLENPMDRNLASCGTWGHKELDTTEWPSPAHTGWIDYGFKNINQIMLVGVVNWRSTEMQQLTTAEKETNDLTFVRWDVWCLELGV